MGAPTGHDWRVSGGSLRDYWPGPSADLSSLTAITDLTKRSEEYFNSSEGSDLSPTSGIARNSKVTSSKQDQSLVLPGARRSGLIPYSRTRPMVSEIWFSPGWSALDIKTDWIDEKTLLLLLKLSAPNWIHSGPTHLRGDGDVQRRT